jgi:hypothetical protein
MNYVWSFWSHPFHNGMGCQWHSLKYHWLSWMLSVNLLRRPGNTLTLVTDDYGARVLQDQLGLGFDVVDVALNDLHNRTHVWSAGKLVAYARQQSPFLHVDNDVFVWQPTLLPDANIHPIIAQHPETITREIYDPVEFTARLARVPAAWRTDLVTAPNCGVLGGQPGGFLQRYTTAALALAELVDQSPPARTSAKYWQAAICVEQYMLGLCLRAEAVPVRYLFADDHTSWRTMQLPDPAALGYTHLFGLAKRNPRLCQWLEAETAQRFPVAHARWRDWWQRETAPIQPTS